MSKLTEKYRPRKIADFIGLEKPKKICSRIVSDPSFDGGLVFVGASGMGKTSLAMALSEELQAEFHHIPSQNCTIDTLKDVRRRCEYVPMAGKRVHLVLVDEADMMSAAAQVACLSYLDGTNPAPNTIWVFTCNSVDRFETRFLSRNMVISFSTQGVSKDATALLEAIWNSEAEAGSIAPNFARIVKEANNNIRTALVELQRELYLA